MKIIINSISKNRKLLLSVFSMILLLALLAACTNTGTTGAGTTAGSASTTANAEPMKLTWIGYMGGGWTAIKDTAVEKMIEEKFNVDIDVVEIDSASSEAATLYFANGGKADYMLGYGLSVRKFVEQGLCQELNFDEMMSNLPDWMESVVPQIGGLDAMKKLIALDGKYYFIPWTRYDYASTEGLNIRKSWLDAADLDVPETVDDIYEMFVAFTKDDPDGNGKDDTYAYSATTYGFGIIEGAFGGHTKDSYYVDDTGSVQYSGIQSYYKEALKFYRKLYDEGLIDPEFMTDDRPKMWEKWGNGLYGCMTLDPYMLNQNQATKLLLDNNPGEEIVYVANLSDSSGKALPAKGYIPLDLQAMIGVDTSAEKRMKIYEIINAIVADTEFGLSVQYGPKDTGWKYGDDDKVVNLLADDVDASRANGAYYFGIVPAGVKQMPLFFSDKIIGFFETSLAAPKYIPGRSYDLFPITSEAFNTKSADVSTLSNEFYFNAITGKFDIDAEWDNYVASIKGAGVDDILAEFQSKVS